MSANTSPNKLRDEVFDRWWPTTQSLDLIEGGIEQVAAALRLEVSRFAMGEEISAGWMNFPDLNSAFRSTPIFTNVPTYYLALPTRSKWTVLWNNSFLCDGYDSLCYCITKNYGFPSMHWSAHDEATTFQSGALFRHRHLRGSEIIERSVYCSQQDSKWTFSQNGHPLDQEVMQQYKMKEIRDRLNEKVLCLLLDRMGARVWREEFYALKTTPCFILRRVSPPQSIKARPPSQVLAHARKETGEG